jgi:RES domain-containing protein
MLPEDQLKAAVAGIPTVARAGPYSRFVGYQYLVPVPPGAAPSAGPLPLWGIGSIRSGARFTPKGRFETVYLGEDPITALAEVEGVFRGYGGSPFTGRTPPVVHVAVEAILLSVLDLTEPSVQAAIGTTYQELTGQWRATQSGGAEAPTQTLGRVCYESGRIDGLRYFSSKNPPDGKCLAVFPERLGGPAYLEVFDPFGNLAQRLCNPR